MSGSIDYSSLFPSSSSYGTPSLLDTLYGTGGSTATSGAASLAALRTAELNETKQVAVTARQADVARDIAAFRKAVATAKTPADLLKNPTALKVLLTANGLADQNDFTALAQKALLSNTKTPNSLITKLSDTRWKPVVQTYDFANKGLAVLKNAKTLDTIANGYAEVAWRKSLDATTPGLSYALDFRSRASSIKSVDQILGDGTLREVITMALGIPKQIAFQGLPAQEKAISTRLDLTKLTDKHFIDSLTQQYLLNKANEANANGTGTPSLDQLAARAGGLVI